MRVFEDQQGEVSHPHGYRSLPPSAGWRSSPMSAGRLGPKQGYLWQYRLEDDGVGLVKGTKVREFGRFSGTGEVEAITVDDAVGYVYYADEGDGIHKWHADPDHPMATRELAHFGRKGFKADREGIAIYARPDGTGYLLCTDQLPGTSEYRVYRREGKAGRPHDHS